MATNEVIHMTKDKMEKTVDKQPEVADKSNGCPCSIKQLLIIIIPIAVVVLFAVIFIPVYLKNKDDEKVEEYEEEAEFDEYNENFVNITYATLTPKDGYDHIFIFLGGISDVSNKYFDFFKTNKTFIPKGTKIYFLCGKPRQMAFMDFYYPQLAGQLFPGWFNVDQNGILVPSNDYTQAKESLELVLNEIDRIKAEEEVEYKDIFLGGFSQGGIMTNYVLLNSRNELGGYLAFSGYVFDHEFPSSSIASSLTDTQKNKLEARKNYHILATHSFNDDAVFYDLATASYSAYYKDYTDFQLYSFGNLRHVLPEQPIHSIVKKWLKESMDK